jgi:transcriptional regulator with XRE-family HTH domain
MRLYQQERAIYEVTELIESVINEEGIGRAQLAKILGKSKGWVTQLLDGEANKTIRTVADVLAALDRELHFRASPIRISNEAEFAGTVSQGEMRWDKPFSYSWLPSTSHQPVTLPTATTSLPRLMGSPVRLLGNAILLAEASPA